MKLKIIQNKFAAAMQNVNQSDFLTSIQSTDKLSADDRIAIYQNSMQAGLMDALAETYDVCKKIVGDEFFNAMALRYIANNPSLSPDLTNYGKTFAEFIAVFEPAKSLPYLADVARFEQAWATVLNGPDNMPLDVEALQQVDDQSEIVFQLPLNSVLFHSTFPVTHIFAVNQDDYQGDHAVSLDEGEDRAIIWRQGLTMRADLLEPQQWQFLKIIASNAQFGKLPEDLMSLLPTAVAKGWIGRFYANTSD